LLNRAKDLLFEKGARAGLCVQFLSDFDALRSAIHKARHCLVFFSFDLLHRECKNPRKTPPLQNLHLGASLSLAVSWSAAILHDTTHSRRRPQRATEREVEEGPHWLDGAEMSWVLAWRVARY